MKKTLQDIAEETGLSISTVSRVLRGKSKRKSKNVDQIIKTAQRLGYPIYLENQSEIFNRKDNILVALIINSHVSEFVASFFDGFREASEESKYRVSLFHTGHDLEKTIELINLLSVSSFDGAILFLPFLVEDDYDKIISNTPSTFTLVSTATVHNPVIDTVTFDSYRGGHLVGKHFFEREYQDVGIILGSTIRNESLLRKSGFTDFVLHRSNMELVWQFEGNYTIESGRNAYQEFKKLKRKPRAIFSSNDYMCLGFLEEARKDQVSIPDELAVVGFDDLPICAYHFPTISSVHTDYNELANSALNLFGEKSRNPGFHQGQLRMQPVSLSIKESS